MACRPIPSRALTQSWVAVNAPSIEAVTEFTVDTNGFKAEFGQASGGIMSFASKSGTNDFHGTAYEFLRNEKLDANNFFNNGRGIARPIYKQHDFGASVGGPVWIPKTLQRQEQDLLLLQLRSVPQPRRRHRRTSHRSDGGNVRRRFPQLGGRARARRSRSTTPPRRPRRRRQPSRAGVPEQSDSEEPVRPGSGEGAGGFPRRPDAAAQQRRGPGNDQLRPEQLPGHQGTEVRPNTKFSVKGDHVFSDKSRISGYWGYNRSSQKPGANGPADLPGFFVNYNDTTRNSDVFRGSWDYAISPTMFNHFYGGGNNWKENSRSAAGHRS